MKTRFLSRIAQPWRTAGPPACTLDKARLPENHRVYAIGDIDGNADLAARMIEAIENDLEVEGAGLECRIIGLGDYLDRGPDSAGVLELLVGLRAQGRPAFTWLKGNHEEMFLSFLDAPEAYGPGWVDFGGLETLFSYGARFPRWRGKASRRWAVSIARTFAAAGKRTLLIDADLRNPSVSRLLGRGIRARNHGSIETAEPPKKRLESVARDPESAVDVIFGAASGLTGSDLLLGSSNFGRLVEVSRQKYDVVIIDRPPVGIVIDPLVILPLVDLVVYVVRFASTGQRAAAGGIREITGSRSAKPLMTVLNLSRDAPGGYYYRRGAADR